jgi:hypothetical protein
MLKRETLVSFVAWKSNVSMTHLALFILLLMPLAGCTGEGGGGPTISSLSTPHDGEEDPIIAMTPTSTGVTAHVTWDPPPGINVAGYTIYYGKRSSEKPRAEKSSSKERRPCSHGESQTFEAPHGTITGLEPNTEYFFAIRAFNENESESLCSNEISAVTPLAQS